MSGLWEPVFGAEAVTAACDDRAWIAALCDVEAALAMACAATGRITEPAASAVAQACDEVAATVSPGALGRLAAGDGNPVIALVALIGERLPVATAGAVHVGATSQDILDTAAMLVVRRSLDVILAAMRTAAERTAALALRHRDTAMIARTLLQQAVPTTFGLVAVGWTQGLDRTGARLAELSALLPVQLGGAGGTLASLHPDGPAVRQALADAVGLRDPQVVWHGERSRIGDLAGSLATAAGACAKVATDIVLMAQSEVGELAEARGGRSSTMPHKHNPVRAVSARAAGAQAPALAATLLSAMAGEHQRAAGSWQGEWLAMPRLLQSAGGAAQCLSESLEELVVDADAMGTNLAAASASLPDDQTSLGHAREVVDDYLQERRR